MADCLLLLFCELRLLFSISAETNGNTTLDLEREEVFDAWQEIFLFLLGVNHLDLFISAHSTFTLVLEEITDADVINLSIKLVDVGDGLGNLRVFGGVVLDIRTNTLTMESMLTGIDKELAIVKDCSEANIAVLSGIDHDVTIFLVASLRTQKFRILRMLFNLGA